MTTQIGFLRAVNVGKRRVDMARVVEVVEELGYRDVWTYANTGNVVFDTTGRREGVDRAMGDALAEEFGFEITTFVRRASELRAALEFAPFEVAAGDTYFVTFLARRPAAAVAATLEAASSDFDTLVVEGRDVHWRMRGSSLDTKVPKRIWSQLGEHASTSRNVTLLRRLAGKLSGEASASPSPHHGRSGGRLGP